MTSATARRISIGVLVCMIAASLLAVPALPPDAAIAVHFDSRGEGDSYASPLAAFAIMPAAVLLAIAAFIATPRFDRRGANLAGSDRAYGVFWLAIVLLLALAHGVIVAQALGWGAPVERLIPLGMGVLFIVTGNMAGKIRANATFGIRTPWTLASDRVWDKTHRLYGGLSVLVGAVLVALSLVGVSGPVLAAVLTVGIGGVALGSAGYSYWLSRHDGRHSRTYVAGATSSRRRAERAERPERNTNIVIHKRLLAR